MSMPLRNRVLLIVAIVATLLVLAALGTLYALQREAKAYVERALATVGTAASVDVAFNLSSVQLTDVRLRPPRGWPAAETLRCAPRASRSRPTCGRCYRTASISATSP